MKKQPSSCYSMSFPRGDLVYLVVINKLAVHHGYSISQQGSWQCGERFIVSSTA